MRGKDKILSGPVNIIFTIDFGIGHQFLGTLVECDEEIISLWAEFLKFRVLGERDFLTHALCSIICNNLDHMLITRLDTILLGRGVLILM